MNELHALEARQLLAADPVFALTSKGTFIVHGTPGGDSVLVYLTGKNGSNVHASMNLSTVDPRFQLLNHEFQVRLSLVKRIRIELGDGTDYANLEGGDKLIRPATILGGNGNDNVDWSSAGSVYVDGGDGNDRLGTLVPIDGTAKKNRDVVNNALAGDQGPVDTILAGAGDDTITGDGNDMYDGGTGNDLAQLVVSGEGKDFPDDRADAIAHDYYARFNPSNVEATQGFGSANT